MMDLLSFIQTADPTKVRVGERQRAEDEPKLLDTTMGRVVPLLPIAPAHAESELDASVDSEDVETVVEDIDPLQPRRKKIVVPDAGGPTHPPKELREDHGTLSVTSVGGKSRSAVQRLLAGAVQNAEVRGEPIPTLPFVKSSLSATLDRKDEVHTGSATGLNLRTIGAPQRPSVLLMTVATTVTYTVDPATSVKEKFVESSVFGGDSSGGGADHTVGGFSDLTGSDFIVGDDGRTCREMVDEFAPLKLFASIRGMEHDQLFTEFNVGAARQISLSAEVRMRAEYNIREIRRLNSVVEEKNSLLKDRDVEIKTLKAQLLVKEAEAAESIRLQSTDLGVKVADLAASVKVREQEVADLDAQVTFAKSQSDNLADRVHELETSSVGLQKKVTAYENFIDQLEKFQDEKMKEVNEKFDKLCTDFVEMTLHLEEKFYPHLLTTIFGHRWLLTHGMELAIAKCLNSTEYLSTLGVAIGKAVEKGMHKGSSAGITHGAEGRKLTDVAVYNPSAEVDYLSALQRVQSVNFSLIAELKANKDASIDTIMNLLRLEDTLAERLDVSSSRVQKIKENIANHVSALRDVFVPLSEPLFAVALEGTKGTSGAAPNTADTTTALSIVVASTSTVRPISIDDYEVTGADDQATADGNVADKDANPFPNVDDAELNVSE
ncbi:hypothetical protein Tco_0286825 [Tanacetum coccineum]